MPTTLIMVKAPSSTARLIPCCSHATIVHSSEDTRNSPNPQVSTPRFKAISTAPHTPAAVPTLFAARSAILS